MKISIKLPFGSFFCYLIGISLANLNNNFFEPEFLKLIRALLLPPLPSIFITIPIPNLSCSTLSPSEIDIIFVE